MRCNNRNMHVYYNPFTFCLSSFLSDSPEVYLSSKPISRNPGTNLTLSCVFDGNPTPNITWLIDGRELDITSLANMSMNVVGHTSMLRFSPIHKAHSGNYSCRADNTFPPTAISAEVSVIVEGENPIFESADFSYGMSLLVI